MIHDSLSYTRSSLWSVFASTFNSLLIDLRMLLRPWSFNLILIYFVYFPCWYSICILICCCARSWWHGLWKFGQLILTCNRLVGFWLRKNLRVSIIIIFITTLMRVVRNCRFSGLILINEHLVHIVGADDTFLRAHCVVCWGSILLVLTYNVLLACQIFTIRTFSILTV